MITHIENGYRALQAFAAHMTQAQQVSDGLLTARVIGEFSAGKTRFLRELLGDAIPPALYPVSSLECQTRLPLEITFGPEAELTLVQRANDCDTNEKTRILQALTKFPERNGTLQHDPFQHRLRLSIPEHRLILKNGDGFSDDHSPKRLFLIDMPGWNSGDDVLAEGDASEMMVGFHNLALVYVVSAVRLDGLRNSDRLNEFLEAFVNAAFVGDPHLIVVMTHCNADEAHHLQAKVRNQVRAMWTELGETAPLSMDVFCIDFDVATAGELSLFRDGFWHSLMSPLGYAELTSVVHPWVHTLQNWPKQWLLEQPIAQTQALLARARGVLQAASPQQGYLVGMNMTKLIGLDAAAIQDRLQDAWRRQLRDASVAEDSQPFHQGTPQIDDRHPLAVWWQTYWVPQLDAALLPVISFMAAVPQALSQVGPQTPSLQAHLHRALDGLHAQAVQAVHNSFTQIADALQGLPKDTPVEQSLATLLRLSLLQMRHQDHLAGHAASVA